MPPEPRPTRIFIAEDDRNLLELLTTRLGLAGYDTVYGRDGWETLDGVHSTRPAVILLDVNMPRLDGFGFIEGVRRNEKYRAIPILVLTTESDAEKKNRARQAGATGWIVKPFDPAKLIDAIERVTA